MTALLILGEDVAHGALAGELVRRTLLEHAEALGAHWFVDHVDATLGWQGEESLAEVRAGLRYTKSSAAAKKLRLRGARPETRHAFPASSAPEAQYWRDVLTWARLSQDLEGIVVATDTDGFDRAVLAAVAQHLPDLDRPNAPRPIVLAIAHPEAESWFVLGFVPTHEAERQRHGELVRALGFDPVTAPPSPDRPAQRRCHRREAGLVRPSVGASPREGRRPGAAPRTPVAMPPCRCDHRGARRSVWHQGLRGRCEALALAAVRAAAGIGHVTHRAAGVDVVGTLRCPVRFVR
jgi:hypothetical protein